MRGASLALMLALWPALASAALTERQFNEVGLSPPPGARVPMNLHFKNADGRDRTIGEAISGRPTLVLPADFTCSQLCGPSLAIVASALAETGLVAGRDYSFVVVGIDARDHVEDARRFTAGQIGGPGVTVLSGDAESIRSLTAAIGYSFQADIARDAIAHPAAVVTLTPDGHISRSLSTLALQPSDLRLALIEAGEGKIGGLAGRLILLCYGFDPVHGIYTRQITNLLRLFGGATALILALAIGLMIRRSKRQGASA